MANYVVFLEYNINVYIYIYIYIYISLLFTYVMPSQLNIEMDCDISTPVV